MSRMAFDVNVHPRRAASSALGEVQHIQIGRHERPLQHAAVDRNGEHATVERRSAHRCASPTPRGSALASDGVDEHVASGLRNQAAPACRALTTYHVSAALTTSLIRQPGARARRRATGPLELFERLGIEDVVAGEEGQHHHAWPVRRDEILEDEQLLLRPESRRSVILNGDPEALLEPHGPRRLDGKQSSHR